VNYTGRNSPTTTGSVLCNAACTNVSDAVGDGEGGRRRPVFRAINKAGRVRGDGMSPKVLWDVVCIAAARAGIDKLAPHDLRRTFARFCHLAGGELDQIQFLLGHVSIQTTERYLGCKQNLRIAVNDRLGIEPGAA
jgi:integrase